MLALVTPLPQVHAAENQKSEKQSSPHDRSNDDSGDRATRETTAPSSGRSPRGSTPCRSRTAARRRGEEVRHGGKDGQYYVCTSPCSIGCDTAGISGVFRASTAIVAKALQIGTETTIVGLIGYTFYAQLTVQRFGGKCTVGEVGSDLIDVITARVGTQLLVGDDQFFAGGELGLRRVSNVDYTPRSSSQLTHESAQSGLDAAPVSAHGVLEFCTTPLQIKLVVYRA